MKNNLKSKLDVINIIRNELDFAKYRFIYMTKIHNNLFNKLDKINVSSPNDYYKFLINPNQIYGDIKYSDVDSNDEISRRMFDLILNNQNLIS